MAAGACVQLCLCWSWVGLVAGPALEAYAVPWDCESRCMRRGGWRSASAQCSPLPQCTYIAV